MYIVTTNNNVVDLQVTHGLTTLNLQTSLQRHHFNFCAAANALAVNSLIFAIIPQAAWELDADDVGAAIEQHLQNGLPLAGLYDFYVVTSSGRRYRVDNSVRDPALPVDHFFPVAGTSLWAAMTQAQFSMARALRRIQEAINDCSLANESKEKIWAYTDFRKLKERKASLDKDPTSAAHPVIERYKEAAILWRNTNSDAFQAQLEEVCGDRAFVGLVKGLANIW